jgi:hypothetical protein
MVKIARTCLQKIARGNSTVIRGIFDAGTYTEKMENK